MENLRRTYRHRASASKLQEWIAPNLQHLMSFEKAVSLSAQISTLSTLLWPGTMIVFQAACRFSTHLKDILDIFSRFYVSLPRFDEYLELYSGDISLAYNLRNLSRDYGQLCVQAMNILKNIVSSGPEQMLKSIVASMEQHKKEFKEEADLILHRQIFHKQKKTSLVHSGPLLPTCKKSTFLVRERRDRRFLDRDTVLNVIHRSLCSPKASQNAEAGPFLFRSLGGIGETSTALEYAYRYRDRYDFVFWLVAETKQDLMRSWAQVVAKIRSLSLIPLGPESGEENVIADYREWFGSTSEKFLYQLSIRVWCRVHSNVNVGKTKNGLSYSTMSRIATHFPSTGPYVPVLILQSSFYGLV
ncbi:hypothetical protein GGR58DRAFT_496932 [Xylaria digitata]|nr:hypothetical protein GGR58DRAFT_496932 [Xylaria digitata]